MELHFVEELLELTLQSTTRGLTLLLLAARAAEGLDDELENGNGGLRDREIHLDRIPVEGLFCLGNVDDVDDGERRCD